MTDPANMTLGECLEALNINVLNDQGGNGQWIDPDQSDDTEERG